MCKRNSVVLVMTGSLAAVPVFTSGFAFYENGAKASAQGGALVARSYDASAHWYNPAALVHLDGGEPRLGIEMHHELRAGGAFDETPVPVEFLPPSIPDADRTGNSLGYGYHSKRWGIDLHAMYLSFSDVTANGLPSDGVISGTYTSTILLAGVTAKYRY